MQQVRDLSLEFDAADVVLAVAVDVALNLFEFERELLAVDIPIMGEFGLYAFEMCYAMWEGIRNNIKYLISLGKISDCLQLRAREDPDGALELLFCRLACESV